MGVDEGTKWQRKTLAQGLLLCQATSQSFVACGKDRGSPPSRPLCLGSGLDSKSLACLHSHTHTHTFKKKKKNELQNNSQTGGKIQHGRPAEGVFRNVGQGATTCCVRLRLRCANLLLRVFGAHRSACRAHGNHPMQLCAHKRSIPLRPNSARFPTPRFGGQFGVGTGLKVHQHFLFSEAGIGVPALPRRFRVVSLRVGCPLGRMWRNAANNIRKSNSSNRKMRSVLTQL